MSREDYNRRDPELDGEWSEAGIRHALEGNDALTTWYAARAVGAHQFTVFAGRLLAVLAVPEGGWANDVDPEMDAKVRTISGWSLGRLGFDCLEPFVSCVMRSEKWELRAGFSDALGEARDPRAVPALVTLLEDADSRVSLWAALGLAKLGDDGVPPLAAAVRKASEVIRMGYIIDALAKIRTVESERALDAFLSGSPTSLRSALDRIRGSSAPSGERG